MSKQDDAIIAEARKRWTKCDEAESAQRLSILEAKKFRAGDQWPSAIKIAREGGNAIQGQPAQPPRPCLVVDRLSQPVRQISNLIKNASFGFDVLPNGGAADKATAEIFKGYLRRVHNESRDESPIEWAADGAIEGGLGWFRIRTEYVHQTWDGDPNDPEVFDQELRLERITNNLTVYCDPSAMKPTRGDAHFLFVTEDPDKDDFADRWPKADMKGLEAFMSTGDMPGWVSNDTIRIAEYWRVTYTNKTFHLTGNGSIVSDDAINESSVIKTSRVMRVPKVEGFKISATEILERWDWAGSRIPIIPILGEELNVDGRPMLRGVIQEGMDAQRMVNYTYSGAMEIFALAPKTPFIAAAGQIENYKDLWQTANIYNYAYLPYDPIDVHGTLIGPPVRQDSEPPIQAAALLMRTSEEAIKATTSTGDASLGLVHPNERSGRALASLQAQSDLANSNYPDNVRRAVIYAAELMVEVIPKITRPGQIVHILGMDDKPEQVMVGKPFQKGPDGAPQASPESITPEIAALSQGLHTFYDLNAGRYAVTVTVGKSTATRREEGADALGQLIPHLPPEMAAIATPDYVKQLDFPGAELIATKLEKALPPQLQGDGSTPPLPPQVQAMIAQLQQENQQLHQAVQTDSIKVQGSIEEAKIKAQTDLQKSQFEASKEIKLQEMKDANAIAVARIAAAKEAMNIAAEAAEERLSTGLEQQHEVGMASMTNAHDQQMAASGQQADAQAQAADQSHQAGMAMQAQDAAAQQAESAAGGNAKP